MKMIRLFIDGKEIECDEGEMLLWAALDNGIYIPNLCAVREKIEPYGACRLCFVEVKGENIPVTACTTKVKEAMLVNTKGPKALRLARTSFELILSNHPVDCAHCLKSGSCELQKIARRLSVKLNTKRFRKFLRDLPIDETSPAFIYDPNKCVLCGKCVWLCQERFGTRAIGFAYRGFQRWVTTFDNEPVGLSECKDRVELVEICPVGAFVARNKWNKKNSKSRTPHTGRAFEVRGK
jgi:formate dehydrogenase major subunit/NADH-quinone oxidoreductase subunit G